MKMIGSALVSEFVHSRRGRVSAIGREAKTNEQRLQTCRNPCVPLFVNHRYCCPLARLMGTLPSFFLLASLIACLWVPIVIVPLNFTACDSSSYLEQSSENTHQRTSYE